MGASEPTASRPRFPRGYGIPESEEGLLSWGWTSERLEGWRNYWLATTNPDGAPHAMPVWGLWLEGAFVFSTSPESRKGRNLARDARAIVHVESDDEVVIVEGQVERIALHDRLAALYEAKYEYRPSPNSADEAWYRLEPRLAYAWDRDYPRTATRFVFD